MGKNKRCRKHHIKERPTCFISCRFDKNDVDVIEYFVKIIQSRGMVAYIENIPGPLPPPEKIRKAIKEHESLAAILTKERELIDGTWKTSDWIHNEIGQAYILDKPIIAFVEDGVNIDGLLPRITTFVPFNRDQIKTKKNKNEIIKAITMLKQKIMENKTEENINRLNNETLPSLMRAIAEQGIIKKITNEDYFYDVGINIINKSKTVRFACKSPALILPKERITPSRKKYYTTLIESLEKRKIIGKYIFSYPRTVEKMMNISKNSKREMLNSLNLLIKRIQLPNLKLKYLPSDDFISCIIGDNEMVYLWKSPTKDKSKCVIHQEGKYAIQEYKDHFDKMFAGAKKVSTSQIKKWIYDIEHRRIITL